MEVHHHARPETPGHRKKWTHYIWEFLMLFLAVFCGFLAENFREHTVEHRREKDYMISMLNDLKADRRHLESIDSISALVTENIDSLIPLLKSDALDENATAIYKHQVMVNIFDKLIYSDRTIQQLKNSGNFRLIRKKNVSDAIMSYDGFMLNYIGEMQVSYILPLWRRINEAGTDIFKSVVFRNYLKSGGWTDHSVMLPDKPYFLTTNKIDLQRFINLLDQYAVATEWFSSNTRSAYKRAGYLDSLIRKEYHLK